jgi:hypothetical protein
LIPDPSFEQTSDKSGLAAGLLHWGSADFTLVAAPVVDGQRAQRMVVPPGMTGGCWFQLAVRPGVTYTQSLGIEVTSLGSGARASMILEWYDSSLRLLGYQTHDIDRVDAGYMRRVQTAQSPAGTAIVRFVVNISGGGSLVMDGAQLEVGGVATPFEVDVPTFTPAPAAREPTTISRPSGG